jgi:hypothetical protein
VVPFEFTAAHLLGLEARPFLDESTSLAAGGVLDRFDDPDGQMVSIVARESAAFPLEDAQRQEIFDLFRWFRLGAGL